MTSRKYVEYRRVSSAAQGASGLGLEAQQEAVSRYVAGGDWTCVGTFTEVETGKGSNALDKRPQLRAALELARRHKATVIFAKLDRLARNVHFISGLMESGVDFIAVDNPNATRLTLHILAAVAEHEREMISQRTKAALAAAKARGTRLGAHGATLATQRRAEALDRLAPLESRLTELRRTMGVRRIAETLMAEGVAAPGGGATWSKSLVHNALRRLDAQAALPTDAA